MNQLDSAIQSNASSSEEVASSAEEMAAQAVCLSQLVKDLKMFVDGHSTQTQNDEKANLRNVTKLKANKTRISEKVAS